MYRNNEDGCVPGFTLSVVLIIFVIAFILTMMFIDGLI